MREVNSAEKTVPGKGVYENKRTVHDGSNSAIGNCSFVFWGGISRPFLFATNSATVNNIRSNFSGGNEADPEQFGVHSAIDLLEDFVFR